MAETAPTLHMPAALVHKPTGRVVVVFDTWPRIDEYGVAPVFRAVIPEGKRQVGEVGGRCPALRMPLRTARGPCWCEGPKDMVRSETGRPSPKQLYGQ
jgi:hypothetical protein